MNKIHFLFGNDSVLISERLSKIKKDLSSSLELNVENVKLSKIEEISLFLNQGSNLSLFPQNSLLVINIVFKALKSLEKEAEAFSSLIKSISNSKAVVLILEIERADKNTKKQLLSSPCFEPIQSDLLVEEFIKLRSWQLDEMKDRIQVSAKLFDLRFEPNALALFVDYFKENLDLVNCELSKLQVYLLPENTITEKVIKELYMPSSNIDDLYEIMLSVSKKSISTVLHGIAESGAVLYNLAVLQNKLRDALKIKSLQEIGMNGYQISKEIGIHSYRVELEIRKLSKVKINDLKDAVLRLSDIELKLKSGLIKDKNALDLLALNR